MLGEVISEGKGKRTGRRVVAIEPSFKVEVSFEEATAVYGSEGMHLGTYASSPNPDGSLSGVGEGVIALSSGEMITWRGIGAGKLAADGSVRYVGCLTYSTASAKFAKLNSIAGAFEFEVSAGGETKSKI